MAARIPVVVSQSIRRENLSIDYEEQLVTELMFSNGLDATLIGPLSLVALDSTDHLCLEGLKGSFALLSWGTADECREELRRLRIEGEVIARNNVPASPTNAIPKASRWIDHFQLDLKEPISKWVDELKQLLKSREIKTYSIHSVASISKKSPPTLDATDIAPRPFQSTIEVPTAAPLPDLTDDDAEWPHLEDLMDEFDQADV
jgi:hypothetical protein